MTLIRRRCSFNAGVYVADADRWRAAGITEQLLRWLELNARLEKRLSLGVVGTRLSSPSNHFPPPPAPPTSEDIYGSGPAGGGSQPPMMLVFYGQHAPLDPLWHVRSLGSAATRGRFPDDFLKNEAKLLHWTGAIKPWASAAQGNVYRHLYAPYEVERPYGV